MKSAELPSEKEAFQVDKVFTVLSFQVKSKENIVITFKADGFLNRVYLKSGESIINIPYVEGEMKQILEIEKGAAEEVVVEGKLNGSETVPSFGVGGMDF